VTKFTPLTNTNQRSTLFISQLRLNKNNLFFAIELSIICVTLIFVITRFFIEHDNSKDNVVVVSAQLNGYQQFMTEPANKRQLIATLQSIRMHNVTRYQHIPWPSKHHNGHTLNSQIPVYLRDLISKLCNWKNLINRGMHGMALMIDIATVMNLLTHP